MPSSPRFLLLLGLGIAAGLPAPAGAQSALDMINQLRPGGATRGLRMPAQEAAPAAAPEAAAPTASRPLPPRTAPPPARMAETTAPAGMPALSITVQFASNSAALTPAVERALTPLGQALASPELAPYRFRIEGHTDTVGPADANAALSLRRAEVVRDLLVQRYNVPVAKLEVVGLGKSQPLVRSGDNQPEQRNRRVQIVNIGG